MQAKRAARLAVALACGYESAAILTGRAPTITRLCGGRRWVAFLMTAALGIHLWWPDWPVPRERQKS